MNARPDEDLTPAEPASYKRSVRAEVELALQRRERHLAMAAEGEHRRRWRELYQVRFWR